MKISRSSLVLAILLAALPIAVRAQFETATVLGTVRDGTGAVIVGSKVTLDPLNPNPFGNAGRNTVRSYAIYQTDLGLHKDFPLWSEIRKLEFRSEFFNLMNKTNFQAPNSTSSSSAFGAIRGTFPARVIPMAMKFVFQGPSCECA
jgi:hypothetical protein